MPYKQGTRPEGTCVYCKRRKRRDFSGLCYPCRDLTRAEGTYDQVALRPDPRTDKKREFTLKVAQYHRLLSKGLKLGEIAAKMGLRPRQLSMVLFHARRRYGLNPVSSRGEKKQHGEAPYGIGACKCEPCRAIRNKTRREQRAAARMPS